MKLFLFTSLLLCSATLAEQTCTHGKLFVTDETSTNVRVFDLSSGNLQDLSPETTISANGKPGIYLDVSGSVKEVAAIFRGTEDIGYTDGVITFIDTGVTTEDHGDHTEVTYTTPKIIENAGFECARAIHFVRHDNKIAIYCDGSYDVVPQVNSTVWVLDETLFGATGGESPIVYTETLQGSHHGVAIPVDDDHVLYSLASEARQNRTPEGADEALPETFQVVDYEGNVLHSIADETSPDTSCSGFHGSSAFDNTFALACDAEHGGILVVDYQASTASYRSRALEYPATYEDHRTGNFLEHPMAGYVVGNFADRVQGSYHLMAFQDTDTELTENQILTLDAAQCAYEVELGEANVVLVLMPTGVLHAFSYQNEIWAELAQVQVVPGLSDCTDVVFTPGYGQAFVLHKTQQMIYAVDLSHVDQGEMDVKTSQLDFVPFDAVVAGVPQNLACHEEHHDDHDVMNSAAPSLMGNRELYSGMLVASAVLAVFSGFYPN